MFYIGLLSIAVVVSGFTYHDPVCNNKQTIVHLFEWKWNDIARECETFLAPNGYCGVQTSVATEHIREARLDEGARFPWWIRYQPVSYKLISRSGDEKEFADMLRRCNNVGVRIYVDIVINHMAGLGRSGTGVAGSPFDADKFDYPAVPYRKEHFNPQDRCPPPNGNINNWSDKNQVRNCYLVGLSDLNQGIPHVADKIVGLLNSMIDVGVAGFRVDTTKHMWPNDLKNIYSRMKDLDTKFGFPANTKPFIMQEVITDGTFDGREYFDTGYVTEFGYAGRLKNAANNIWDFNNIDQGLITSEHALVFVDNHDSQRGHGGGGDFNYKAGAKYKRAVAFLLAHPYGFSRVMSSYEFTNGVQGPPSDSQGNTNTVPINADGSCGGGWVCEHRWPLVSGMVGFRNAVKGTPIQNWKLEDGVLSFSRGSKGFFATSSSGHINRRLQTGLTAGTYCDVVSNCQQKIVVDSVGMAEIKIANSDNPAVAFYVGSKTPVPGTTSGPQPTTNPVTPGPQPTGNPVTTAPPLSTPKPGPTTTLAPGTFRRTVVFLKAVSQNGQDLFFRGGGLNGMQIPLRYRNIGSGSHYAKFKAWSTGDTVLDWQQSEINQGSYGSTPPQGSPAVWTSRTLGSNGLNKFGDHYWMLDVDMDCSKTNNGWFEIKGFMSNGQGHEMKVRQGTCSGDAGQGAPSSSIHGNHIGRCGYLNIFAFNKPDCQVMNIP